MPRPFDSRHAKMPSGSCRQIHQINAQNAVDRKSQNARPARKDRRTFGTRVPQ